MKTNFPKTYGVAKRLIFSAVAILTAFFSIAPLFSIKKASAEEVTEVNYQGTEFQIEGVLYGVEWYREGQIVSTQAAWQAFPTMSATLDYRQFINNRLQMFMQFGGNTYYMGEENAFYHRNLFGFNDYIDLDAHAEEYTWRETEKIVIPWYDRVGTSNQGRESILTLSDRKKIGVKFHYAVQHEPDRIINFQNISTIKIEYANYGKYPEEMSLREKYNLISNPLHVVYITYTDNNGYTLSLCFPCGTSYKGSYTRVITPTDDYIYNQGFTDGQQQGYSSGYEDGKQAGDVIGYRRGYNEGTEVALKDTPFLAWVTTVMQSVLDCLNVKIFGYFSILDIILLVVFLSIIMLFLKIARG